MQWPAHGLGLALVDEHQLDHAADFDRIELRAFAEMIGAQPAGKALAGAVHPAKLAPVYLSALRQQWRRRQREPDVAGWMETV